MRIQYICNENKIDSRDIKNAKLNSVNDFDDFDINIIDLNFPAFMTNSSGQSNIKSAVNDKKDLISINKQIVNSVKATTIIILPSNMVYKTHFNSVSVYNPTKEYHIKGVFKDALDDLLPEITCIFPLEFSLIFGKLKSSDKDEFLESDFSFSVPDGRTGMMRSYECDDAIKHTLNDKGKIISISDRSKKVIYTTLLIKDYSDLDILLKTLKLKINEGEVIPDWFKEIKMFDDTHQDNIIRDSKMIIEMEEDKIGYSIKILEENNRIKSILYSTGQYLEEIVREILGYIFEVDTALFVDKKNEDFIIDKDDYIFIGEVKGLEKNASRQNLTQINNHVNRYMDENEERIKGKTVKGITIVNTFRLKPIKEREAINLENIKAAEKIGSLVVLSQHLLEIYDNIKYQSAGREKYIEMFKNQIGLLKIEE